MPTLPGPRGLIEVPAGPAGLRAQDPRPNARRLLSDAGEGGDSHTAAGVLGPVGLAGM